MTARHAAVADMCMVTETIQEIRNSGFRALVQNGFMNHALKTVVCLMVNILFVQTACKIT